MSSGDDYYQAIDALTLKYENLLEGSHLTKKDAGYSEDFMGEAKASIEIKIYESILNDLAGL